MYRSGERSSSLQSNPDIAVLFYGGLVIYAGDCDAPESDNLVRQFDVQPAILGYSDGWNRQVKSAFGDRLNRVARYHLPHTGLDHAVADNVLKESAVVYRATDADNYTALQDALGWEHHLYHFAGVDDFLANGNGALIEQDGQIISGASSYAVSAHYSECQVTTIESARRNGYARLLSAAYLRRCREKGLSTPWDAANQASVALARTVGYADVAEYHIFELF